MRSPYPFLDETSDFSLFTGSSKIVKITGGTFEENNNAGHGSSYTHVDCSSLVINGDLMKGQGSGSLRAHNIQVGSVQNGSKLVNGDMDPESFLLVFGQKY